jgi:hypothetical protein
MTYKETELNLSSGGTNGRGDTTVGPGHGFDRPNCLVEQACLQSLSLLLSSALAVILMPVALVVATKEICAEFRVLSRVRRPPYDIIPP